MPSYLFSTCQLGAEGALKSDMARREPELHLAFSRPGFVTFKLPAEHRDSHVPWQSAFARTQGFALGKVSDSDAAEFWHLASQRPWDRLHVWQRDTPRSQQAEQEADSTSHEAATGAKRVAAALREALAGLPQPPISPNQLDLPTRPGDVVLDCVLVEPGLWWAGWHTAQRPHSCWPGGIPPIELPAEAVSRAWLKMEEALLWSQLPLGPGQRVAEIGCAPGGAAQALLDRELLVTGIDPALVDPRVAEHPNFTHIRKRGHEVRRREFRKTRWLVVDMNVAPRYTLDTVEAIVLHPEVNVRGMLLTLKLIDWSMAQELPLHLARIRSWGFADVRARQLAYNRQELCVAALRKKSSSSR